MSDITKRVDELPLEVQVNYFKNLLSIVEAERDAAIDRIKDILMQDDGQAYKEAEKFLECYVSPVKNDESDNEQH